MFESLIANPAASIVGAFALICLVIWPLFPGRKGMLLTQIGVSAGFASHYALLGAWAASSVCAIGAAQTVIALFSQRSEKLNCLGYAAIPLMIFVGLLTGNGPEAWLAVIGMVLIAAGRMQTDQFKLRALILSGCVFWAAHDLWIGSFIAFSADMLSVAIGLSAMARLYRQGSLTLPLIFVNWRSLGDVWCVSCEG